MLNFDFYLPTKLVFGVGAVKNKLADELKNFDSSTVLLITDKGVISAGLLNGIEETLKSQGIEYSIFDEVEPNPSTDTCVKAHKMATDIEADTLIAVGGGSSMDVAKATGILMNNGGILDNYEGVNKFSNPTPPMLFIPTTAGTGSEVTPFAVITIKKRNYKMTIVSSYCLPKVTLLDPTLISTLPAHVAAACGMDALTHAIESYLSLASSPATEAMAEKAINLIGKNLRCFVANRGNIEAASAMIVASNLAGIAFGISRLGNVHAMGHPLSGFFNVPHGVANSILLPHVMKFNKLADNGKYRIIAELLGEDVHGLTDYEAAEIAVSAVQKLSDDVGIPKTLKDFNVKPELIPQMAEDAMASGNIKVNPRTTTFDDVVKLYEAIM